MNIKIKDEEYKIIYCPLCEDIALVCSHCENSSCNGGGCDTCHYAFENRRRYLKKASIPGEFFFRLSSELHLKMKEMFEERHALYKQIRKLEKEKAE